MYFYHSKLLFLFHLKENSIKRKINASIKALNKRPEVVKPVRRVVILNNPQSKLDFENLKYIQKVFDLSNIQFDIFTFKEKNGHYNELPGIVADKNIFSVFGKIKTPEIQEFLEKKYDLLLDFTGMPNLYEKYLSLAIKASFRVGYINDDELYDLMLDIPKKNIKLFADETVKYLKIIKLI